MKPENVKVQGAAFTSLTHPVIAFESTAIASPSGTFAMPRTSRDQWLKGTGEVFKTILVEFEGQAIAHVPGTDAPQADQKSDPD